MQSSKHAWIKKDITNYSLYFLPIPYRENLTGIPSPDSVADSPCLRPSLSNGHCTREATTFTFPAQGDQRGVPEVKTTTSPLFQRTRLEKRLIILAVILAACSVTMVTILFVQWHSSKFLFVLISIMGGGGGGLAFKNQVDYRSYDDLVKEIV